MAIILGVVSQKGGVGKSTVARLMAREYAAAGWNVKIADMDVSQATTYHWQSRRLQYNAEPVISVEQFSNVDQAIKLARNYDLIIFDGAPHATSTTLKIAQHSDLVVLPTGLSLDDLEPTVRLAHELKQKGIPKDKIAFALCRIGESENEVREAADYIAAAGYFLLSGAMPEKIAYRRASDIGRAATETTYRTLNQKADELAQAIVNRMDQQTKKAKQKGIA
jgi:chromosome partitioning protein